MLPSAFHRLPTATGCHSGLRDIQPEELGAGGSCADGTVPGLVIQAGLHQLEVGVEREFAFGEELGEVRGHPFADAGNLE